MARRLLTVEDSASMRQVVGFTLRGAGYKVVEALDGEDALDKIRTAPVAMVVTDLNMPRLDGIGLIRCLRADPSHRFIPIAMLTTESQDTKKQEGKSAGAKGWTVKPFKPEQLLGVVKKVLKT